MVAAAHYADITTAFPFSLPQHLIAWQTKKFSLMYSNMAGPKSGYNFGGTQMKSITAFAPILGSCVNGVIPITTGGVLKIGFTTCRNYIDSPDEFMDLLEQFMRAFLKWDQINSETISKM